MERHPFSWIRKINTVKMILFPKSMYIVNTMQTKNPSDFFTEIDKLIIKFIWKFKGPMSNKKNLKKEE